LIELAPIRGIPRGDGRIDRLELNERIISLHVDAHEFAERFEEHLKVLPLRRDFVKVDDEEGVVGLDPFTTFVLLALDPTIAACKFGPKTVRDGWDIPVQTKELRDDEVNVDRVGLGLS
jgi:hypothetical protein